MPSFERESQIRFKVGRSKFFSRDKLNRKEKKTHRKFLEIGVLENDGWLIPRGLHLLFTGLILHLESIGRLDQATC